MIKSAVDKLMIIPNKMSEATVYPEQENQKSSEKRSFDEYKRDLVRIINDDRAKLIEWSALDPVGSFDIRWWIFSIVKLGGSEKIALRIRSILMDYDYDGRITDKEIQESEDLRKEAVEQSLNLFTAVGVVAGLLISVLFSVALTPLSPSDESSQYFAKDTLTSFTYIYYFGIYMALALSLFAVYSSINMYIHLSTWMADLNMKTWYLNNVSMMPLIASAAVAVYCLAIAILFGKCILLPII